MMLLMVLHSLEYLKAHVLGTHIFLIYNNYIDNISTISFSEGVPRSLC